MNSITNATLATAAVACLMGSGCAQQSRDDQAYSSQPRTARDPFAVQTTMPRSAIPTPPAALASPTPIAELGSPPNSPTMKDLEKSSQPGQATVANSVAEATSDMLEATRLETVLGRDKSLANSPGIKIDVSGKTVYLRGKVTSPEDKVKAERDIKNHAKKEEVVLNQLNIKMFPSIPPVHSVN